MGALKPLELPNDPEEVEQEEEVEEEIKQSQSEGEPVIKDVDQIDSSTKPTANVNPITGEDANEIDEIAEDIFSNFGLAI